jgi:F-type H+-transporting ATPase subunit a
MAHRRFIPVLFFFFTSVTLSFGQNHDQHASNNSTGVDTLHTVSAMDTAHTNNVATDHNTVAGHAHNACGFEFVEKKGYDPGETILNHIANANEFHLFGHISFPLPCILYSKEDGIKSFMSSKFHHGAAAYDRYVSDHGITKRIKGSFPDGEVELEALHGDHYIYHDSLHNGFICFKGQKYELEKASTLIQASSFYDFSITKNVFTMLMAGILLLTLFTSAAKKYATNKGKAPSGTQNLLEVLVQFITDEVAKPMIGEKYFKYLPYLLTIFFFILTNNLFGLIPFAPFGSNVTGHIATTAALALIAFLVTNFNGKADYWKHIFWMPGVPVPMKIFLAPIELLGIFTKPISLMIRLFANITAGHIIILALVGLIFFFGKAGESLGGSIVGTAIAVPFTLFLSIIELIVAFIQAFIFTILTASYIGGAIEEHHHDEAHH